MLFGLCWCQCCRSIEICDFVDQVDGVGINCESLYTGIVIRFLLVMMKWPHFVGSFFKSSIIWLLNLLFNIQISIIFVLVLSFYACVYHLLQIQITVLICLYFVTILGNRHTNNWRSIRTFLENPKGTNLSIDHPGSIRQQYIDLTGFYSHRYEMNEYLSSPAWLIIENQGSHIM